MCAQIILFKMRALLPNCLHMPNCLHVTLSVAVAQDTVAQDTVSVAQDTVVF